MAGSNVLRWLDGQGWLVLSATPEADSAIRAQVIDRAAADGAVAYVSLAADATDAILTDMESLGAPSGYMVDVLSEDDETIRTKLSEASIIVVSSGGSAEDVRSALLGSAVEGMRIAFENGAVILAEGAAAAVLGSWIVRASGDIVPGLAWFLNTVIIPDVVDAGETPTAKTVLARQPLGIAVGLGKGSALALGPQGEVETWGSHQVGVVLGPGFSAA